MHPKATGFGCIFSVNNIDRYFLSGALRIGADDCTDLFGDAALTSDHLAHIVGRNVQLQRQLVRSLLLRHRDLIRMLDQIFGDVEQQVLHALSPADQIALILLSSARTVSVGWAPVLIHS